MSHDRAAPGGGVTIRSRTLITATLGADGQRRTYWRLRSYRRGRVGE
jgi:hypothetical protein